jgi:hypothetical protein
LSAKDLNPRRTSDFRNIPGTGWYQAPGAAPRHSAW